MNALTNVLADIELQPIRKRATIFAAIPFAMVFALMCAIAVSERDIRWTWKMVSKPLQLSGAWFAGWLAPVFGSHVLVDPILATVGWAFVLAWLWTIWNTRLGNLGSGIHCIASFLWLIAGFFGLGYAGIGV